MTSSGTQHNYDIVKELNTIRQVAIRLFEDKHLLPGHAKELKTRLDHAFEKYYFEESPIAIFLKFLSEIDLLDIGNEHIKEISSNTTDVKKHV